MPGAQDEPAIESLEHQTEEVATFIEEVIVVGIVGALM